MLLCSVRALDRAGVLSYRSALCPSTSVWAFATFFLSLLMTRPCHERRLPGACGHWLDRGHVVIGLTGGHVVIGLTGGHVVIGLTGGHVVNGLTIPSLLNNSFLILSFRVLSWIHLSYILRVYISFLPSVEQT